MEPFLLYSDPGGRRHMLELTPERDRVTIGRRASCDVALEWDVEVSRLHAALVRMGPDWVVHDEGLSRNGTYLNGERVCGRRRLAAGDGLTVGGTLIMVCGAETTASAVPTRAARSDPRAVRLTPAQKRLLAALSRPLLEETGYRPPASNRMIAHELTISVDTVKGTLSALYELFGLSALGQNEKRAALAVRALPFVQR